MFEIDLDDYEKEVIRFLAKHYDEKRDIVEFSEFPHFDELKKRGVIQKTTRLMRYDLLSDYGTTGYRIRPAVLEVVHQLDHPPPKDYWATWITWVRSKRWLIPFLVLAIVLPLLVQWVGMIKTLLQWVGIFK